MIKNILSYIKENALMRPDSIAVEAEDSSLTYGELYERIEVVGTSLANAIKCTNEPVVVFMDKSIECLTSFFAVQMSGCFYVCIDNHMAPERIKNIFSTLEPVAIIKKAADQLVVETDAKILDYETLAEGQKDEILLQDIQSKVIDTDPAYVLFTSGSTGMPKGSVISHKSALSYAQFIKETFDISSDTNFGSQTPFYFSMSVLDIYTSLMTGACITIIPKQYFSFPVTLFEYLRDKHVNTIYWVPSALGIVANWKAYDYVELTDLKKILFAGEVMPAKYLNAWKKAFPNAMFANLFGPTEITDIALYYIVNRDFRDEESIPIGVASNNMECFALTEDGKKAGVNEEGELYYRGSFVGLGYYNNPEKTKDFFVQNPLNTRYPEIVYKSGDLVKLNEYGEFMYLGRKDFQIKHMGYRIELGEIEAAATANENVQMCACLYNSSKDRIIMIYQGKISDADLAVHIEKYLPMYMRPAEYIKLLALPINANGKIDRQKLKADYIDV